MVDFEHRTGTPIARFGNIENMYETMLVTKTSTILFLQNYSPAFFNRQASIAELQVDHHL
jgi:hypothetical protein